MTHPPTPRPKRSSSRKEVDTGCLTPPPRGLSREAAAAYIGVSPGTFDEMVRDGRMPRPKPIGARKVWDRHALDLAFDALPTAGQPEEGTGWEDV